MSFPAGDLDKPATILSYLGSFWSRTYDGADQLRVYADGLGRACEQIEVELDEAVRCLGVRSVPVLHRDAWRPVTLTASSLVSPTTAILYGGGSAYGDGTRYGTTRGIAGAVVPLADIAEIPLILDAVDAATVTLVAGLDYTFDGVNLTLAGNPATDPRWTTTPVYNQDGAIIDTELVAWCYRPGVDRRYAANHFGYVLGLTRPSTPEYRDLLIALWDALILGPSTAVLSATLAAILGVATTRRDGEVVEVVEVDSRGLFVATDQAVYRYPATANPIVAVGDVLAAGDQLVDAVTIVDLSAGATALPAGLIPILALPVGVLAPGFLGALGAEDIDYPLTVGSDYAGRTTVRFPLVGFPADVAEFWRRVDLAGTQAGATSLARCLDVRGPTAATEPTAASLPAVINPLRFLLDNVLRGSACLVKVNAAAIPDPTSLADLSLIRRVLPPATLCLIAIDLAPLADTPQDEVPDTIASMLCPPIIVEDVVTSTDFAEVPRILAPYCQ